MAPATLALLLIASAATAHLGGNVGSGSAYEPAPPSLPARLGPVEPLCPDPQPEHREAQTLHGVEIEESLQCHPDDPRWIAAFVKGTNNVPEEMLDEVGLHRQAVVKCCDRDGDGDPDLITITLEVAELNGWHLDEDLIAGEGHAIAPGVKPGFWVFAPKTTIYHGGPIEDLVRAPSPSLRVEQGDTVQLRLENTHYIPHTIHLHGVDHPFLDADGEGNDGVPHASEGPVLPGEARVYDFTPRQAGTMFYHCHVQPQVHVPMGLNGAIIVEEQRADNWVQTINVGAGDVRHPSVAVREEYDREYDLHYQEVDKELHQIVTDWRDPRHVAEQTTWGYDITDADPDYFLLNGRSFPYTLRESVLWVEEDEDVKLRVLNGGAEPVSLHAHGHKPTVTHYDGVEAPPGGQIQRDVHFLSAAQRLDLYLSTKNDGLDSYGPGVWFMHDHREQAVTTDGVSPGGDITTIAYTQFRDNETSLPVTQGHDWRLFFRERYYDQQIPAFAMTGEEYLLEAADPERPVTGVQPYDLVIYLAAALGSVVVLGFVLLQARRFRK